MLYRTFLLACACALMTACASDSDNDNSAMAPTDPPTDPAPDNPSPTGDVRFSQLVRDILAQTSDTGEPVDINTSTIEFDHNESHFDDLF